MQPSSEEDTRWDSLRTFDGRCFARVEPLAFDIALHIRILTIVSAVFVNFRRLVAVILLLAFGATVAEAGMADVHDGDATHSELQRYAAVVAHAATPADTAPHPGEPTRSGHTQHTCHCTHVHFGWVVSTVFLWPPVFVEVAPPRGPLNSELSVVLSPQLRPPIA